MVRLVPVLALLVLAGCCGGGTTSAPTAPGGTQDDFEVIQLGWGQPVIGIP